MLNILKDPLYFRFWLSQIISHLGDGLTRVAIMYLIATLSNNPFIIGIVIFAQLLPSALFSIFMGPLADKYNRKVIMVSADLFRMVVVVLMIPFTDSVPILISLIALQGIGSALFDPARASAIPDLCGEENLTKAISLSQSTKAAMDIIGPSIGALLLISQNYTLIFLIDSSTFLLSAILVLTLTTLGKVKGAENKDKEPYFIMIKSGISTVMGMSGLRFLIILLIPITLVIGILNTNLVAVLTNTFKVTAFHFGLIEAALALGVIVGASFVGPKLISKVSPATVLLSGTAAIGIWMVLVIPLDYIQQQVGIFPIYIWCIMIGILNALITVPLNSLFLKTTPNSFRGRGSSLLSFTANNSQILGVILGGVISNGVGVLNGTAIAGSLLVLVACLLPLLKGYKEFSYSTNDESNLTENATSSS
ncbi:MFS transporter [Neobacillus niacini]|uniref:MFS transporter n=1 Tax=Neobacillus niacini TaxID=86668 RepID=UPI0030002ABA